MPEAVSNSSTLIHLSAIGRLPLLNEFFDKVLVPSAVWDEVVVQGGGRAGSTEVEQARQEGWLEVVRCENEPMLHLLRTELDEGESEAIVLALERQPDILLLDESDARRHAEKLGLRKTGIVGLLIRARKEGKLHSLKEALDELRTTGHFWIHEALYRRALAEVGE